MSQNTRQYPKFKLKYGIFGGIITFLALSFWISAKNNAFEHHLRDSEMEYLEQRSLQRLEESEKKRSSSANE